jgi:hypothetical protein
MNKFDFARRRENHLRKIYEKRLLNVYKNMFSKNVIDFCGEAHFSVGVYDYKQSGLNTNDAASHEPNKNVTYYINRNGIIGKEFIENAEILAAGCSFTAGIGLSTGLSWPYIVGERTRLSFNQLGIPGGSIQQITTAIFEFIKIYGKPRYLLFLIPEAGRQWIYVDTPPYRERFAWSKRHRYFLSHENFAPGDSRGEDVSLDIVIQNSFHALKNLQDFCAIEGIKFKFYSWDPIDNRVYSELGIENFINPNKSLTIDGCEHDGKNVEFWDAAVDSVHPGIHQQIHFAEAFLPL